MSLSRKRAKRTTVGLDIDADSIAAAELGASDAPLRGAVQPLPEGAVSGGEIVDSDVVAAATDELFDRHGLSRQVRLAVAGQGVAFRVLRLPYIEDAKHLRSAVCFQAGEQIPMPLEDAVLDHQVIDTRFDGDGNRQVDVAVVAVRRDSVEAILETARKADLEPVGIDFAAFGLIRALAPDPDAPRPEGGYAQATLYCSLGGITNLAIARDRACLFSRVAQFSVRDIAEELVGKTGLTLEHAEQWLLHTGLTTPEAEVAGDPAVVATTRSLLMENVVRLADELRFSLDFYRGQVSDIPVDGIVLCGWGSAIPGLTEELSTILGRAVSVERPQSLLGLDDQLAARLVLPFGLALEL